MALSPDGRLVVFVRHARHGDATVCSWTRSRRGDAFQGTEGAHRAVLFARRRVDRILGRQQDQEGAGRGRAARHDLRACRKEVAGVRAGERTAPSSSLARRASPKCLRPGEQPATVTTPDAVKGERHLLPQRAARWKSAPVHDHDLRRWETANVVLQSLDTGERRVLIPGGADARYVSTGHLVYMKTGTLMAVPFDVRSRQVTGAPVALDRGRHARGQRTQRRRRNRSGTVRGVRLRDPALRRRWHQSDSRKLVGVGR